MKGHIGDIRNNQLGYQQLALLAKETSQLAFDQLELDFATCSFFEANMAAPLGAILAQVSGRLNRVSITRVPDATERILRKNGFLCQYGFDLIVDTNQTAIPFRRYRLSEDRRFAEHLGQYLVGKGVPPMTAALNREFLRSILEVFQNASSHSESEVGAFVCGQFFPKKERLDLTIADGGIGIREQVRRKLGVSISSVGAIRWAFQPGHTTRIGPNPGGMGLKLLRDFIVKNGGRIQILSRQGYYELANHHETTTQVLGDFPGTSVNLEINTADTNTYRLASESASHEAPR